MPEETEENGEISVVSRKTMLLITNQSPAHSFARQKTVSEAKTEGALNKNKIFCQAFLQTGCENQPERE